MLSLHLTLRRFIRFHTKRKPFAPVKSNRARVLLKRALVAQFMNSDKTVLGLCVVYCSSGILCLPTLQPKCSLCSCCSNLNSCSNILPKLPKQLFSVHNISVCFCTKFGFQSILSPHAKNKLHGWLHRLPNHSIHH